VPFFRRSAMVDSPACMDALLILSRGTYRPPGRPEQPQ
jgi:hypothetical protein